MMPKEITNEYIRGLVEGEGCFTFCSANYRGDKRMIPTFLLGLNRRDKDLLIKIRDSLRLRNKVYEYPPRIRKDGYKRGGMAILIVRDIGQIKNIIVPLFYRKLNGYKAVQFDIWLERIGSDPLVPKSYKLIHRLYNSGFYENNFRRA